MPSYLQQIASRFENLEPDKARELLRIDAAYIRFGLSDGVLVIRTTARLTVCCAICREWRACDIFVYTESVLASERTAPIPTRRSPCWMPSNCPRRVIPLRCWTQPETPPPKPRPGDTIVINIPSKPGKTCSATTDVVVPCSPITQHPFGHPWRRRSNSPPAPYPNFYR